MTMIKSSFSKKQRDGRLHCFVLSDLAQKCGYKPADSWYNSGCDDEIHDKIIDEQKKEAFTTDF